MAALIVLLAASLALLPLPLLRSPPGAVPAVAAAGLAAALVACLSAPARLPLAFAVDGWSAVTLASLFLVAAGGAVRPVPAGLAALALLAADGVGLLAAVAMTALVGPPAAGGARGLGPGWMRAAAAALCLSFASLALGGLDPAFGSMHGVPWSGPWNGPWGVVLALAGTAAAAVLLGAVPGPGGLLAVYLVGRLLLDLPGPVTPGWWGGPVLALGSAAALAAAHRAATADALDDAIAAAGTAAAGLALVALGAALLARGADLLPLASMAGEAASLLLLAAGLWRGLLTAAAAVVQEAAGPALARLGGVLRHAPATGLALLVGLLSMAAVPVTPGFAGTWLAAQALLGTARSGGLGVLLLVAGAAAVLAGAAALLAAAAVRLGGMVLLGVPRAAKAMALSEPPRRVRLALAALVAASLLLGAVPGLGLLLARQATAVLAADPAGGPRHTPGWSTLGLPDAPGYLALAIAVLLILPLGAGAWSARGRMRVAAAWQGGFAEDGVGRDNPARLRPDWRWPPWSGGPLAVSLALALALALALLLGWAAR